MTTAPAFNVPVDTRTTDQLIAEYEREYLRTLGRSAEVSINGRWFSVNGNTFSRSELISAIDKLKHRADFVL